jgi:hypothetical protein
MKGCASDSHPLNADYAFINIQFLSQYIQTENYTAYIE